MTLLFVGGYVLFRFNVLRCALCVCIVFSLCCVCLFLLVFMFMLGYLFRFFVVGVCVLSFCLMDLIMLCVLVDSACCCFVGGGIFFLLELSMCEGCGVFVLLFLVFKGFICFV